MKKLLVVLVCLAGIFLFQHADAELLDGAENAEVVPLYTPTYTCTGTVFNDVNPTMYPPPGGDIFCGFIEHFSALGITGGCSTSPPLYCPNNNVTRAQMAVFISKALQDIISQSSLPYNTALGNGSLVKNTTGGANTGAGYLALHNNTQGLYNSALGFNALRDNTTGLGNSALGTHAGAWHFTTTTTTGSFNTFIGAFSGQGTATQLTNATAVGAQAKVSANNSLVLGGTAAYKVKVGIGTEIPGVPLDVNGPGYLIGRFTNDGSATDKTALLGLVSGDTTPRRWHLGVGGSGNGLGYASGQFYLERVGGGVAMAFDQSRNVSFFPASGQCSLTNGATGWACSSDRDLKENFEDINRIVLLESLSGMPVTKWNVKGSSEKHIGPTAQDFYAAFRVGDDDTRINTVDAQGVSLAAIQGLYQLVKEQQARISQLEDANAELRADIEKRLAVLEPAAKTVAQR